MKSIKYRQANHHGKKKDGNYVQPKPSFVCDFELDLPNMSIPELPVENRKYELFGEVNVEENNGGLTPILDDREDILRYVTSCKNQRDIGADEFLMCQKDENDREIIGSSILIPDCDDLSFG